MKDHEITSNPLDYQGRETLGDLTVAKNYNGHLVSLILKYCTKASHVADFGAGNGSFTQAVSEHVSSIYAIEPDPQLGQEIRKSGLQLRDLDAIEDNSLDLIFSLNVFEHIKGDAEILSQLVDKVRPGGRILIYVPAAELLYSKFDSRIGHFRRYSLSRGLSLMRDSRLRVTTSEYHDPIGFFAALAYKIFDNSGNLKTSSIKLFDGLIYPLSKAIQPFTKKLFGKNLLLVAEKF